MTFIYWYIIFALATGFASLYTYYIPALKEVAKRSPDSFVVKHKYLSLTVLTSAAVLLAPLKFIIYCSKNLSNRYYNNLIVGLLKD